MRRYYVFFCLLLGVGLGAIIWQSVASGPIKADEALVSRIEQTQSNINDYSSRHFRLPAGLSEVKGDHTGINYETSTAQNYKLCGNFQTSSHNQHPSTPTPVDTNYINARDHGAGAQCFNGTLVLPPTKP